MGNVQIIAIAGVIENAEGKILVLRRALHDSFPGQWEIPGGGLEFGEDPYEAVKREVKEECGLDVEVKRLLEVSSYTSQKDQHHRHFLRILFECTMLDYGQPIVLSHEHIEYKWVSEIDIDEMDGSRFLRETVKILKK